MSEPAAPRPDLSPPDPDRFRGVISRFATGVTVMTCECDGEPHGMTANAVSSVSLDPLLVLVCVEQDTEMRQFVRESQAFALSILPASAEDVSNHFADGDRATGAEQFAGVGTRTAVTGSPVLEVAIGWIDCRVWKIHDGGDHDIVVGEVVDCDLGGDEPALGYFRSAYTTISS